MTDQKITSELTSDTLLLLNEAISLGRRDGMAGQHLGAMCSARDEIERLSAVADAARDLCSTRTSQLSPYISGKCDLIRTALEKLDTGCPKTTSGPTFARPSHRPDPVYSAGFADGYAAGMAHAKPHGCVCPAGAEVGCKGFGCPRRVITLGIGATHERT